MESGQAFKKNKDFGEFFLTALGYIIVGLVIGLIIDNIFGYLATRCQMKSPFLMACVQLLFDVLIIYGIAMAWSSIQVGYCAPSMHTVLFMFFFFSVQQNMIAGLSNGFDFAGSKLESGIGDLYSDMVSATEQQEAPAQQQSGQPISQGNLPFDLSNYDKEIAQKLLSQMMSGQQSQPAF